MRRGVHDPAGGVRATSAGSTTTSSWCTRTSICRIARACAGHACWYAADAVVRHAGSATLGAISSAAVFYGQRNLEWTWIKNTPRRLLWRTFASHLLSSAAGVFHYIGRGQGVAAVKGKAAALAGLRPVLAKRRGVQCASRVDVASIERLLTRGWFGLKRAEKDGLQARE